MPVTLICPSCGTRLTVSDHAPAALTCPKCLARITNPHAGAAPPPLPVIPVEQQIRFDERGATIGAVVFVVVLTGTATLTDGASLITIVLAAVLAVVVGAFIYITFRPRPPIPPVTPTQEAAAHVIVDGDQKRILSYRSRAQEEQTSVGAFVGGFFAALGMCGLGVLALGSTTDLGSSQSQAAVLLAVVIGVLAYIFLSIPLAARPGWRGFGRGTLIGMILGMLALGPCAFCYTMTI